MKKQKAILNQIFFSFGSFYNETEDPGFTGKITQVEALKY